MARPRKMEDWIPWVNEQIRRLQGSRWSEVPVGGLVLYPSAGVSDFDEPDWLICDGSTFNAEPDDSDSPDESDDIAYPDLADALGGTKLPTQAALDPPTGFVYIIRAE